MSARLARATLASFRAATRSRINVTRRHMSAQSQGAQPTKKSDLPWIIGSGLVFGPILLYLVSPSARKARHEHAVHDDKHDFPGLKMQKDETYKEEKAESAGPEIMKDDEGTPADVSQSVALAQESDVPNDAVPPESFKATSDAAERAPVGDEAAAGDSGTEGGANVTQVKTEDQEKNLGDKAPDTHDISDKSPADQTKAREVTVQKGEAPAHEKAEA